MGSYARFEHYLTTLEMETRPEPRPPTMVFPSTVRPCVPAAPGPLHLGLPGERGAARGSAARQSGPVGRHGLRDQLGDAEDGGGGSAVTGVP